MPEALAAVQPIQEEPAEQINDIQEALTQELPKEEVAKPKAEPKQEEPKSQEPKELKSMDDDIFFLMRRENKKRVLHQQKIQ